VQALREIYNTGKMPKKLSEGLIYIIPKATGISSDIRQWHPITLLNTIYKIMAKTLSNRIQPFLSDIIHDSQTSFKNGRSIMANIFTFWEISAIAESSSENLAV
jgi:hypothetical protein